MIQPALPASAYVILGLLGLGLRSGYEIKRAADESTRHFAAISFRQIYPELKRMEQLGLVRGTPAPTGERRRTHYELTPAGEAALDAWLRSADEMTVELRHGGLLKLFFADRLKRRDRLAIVERIRSHHQQAREALAQSRPTAQRRRERRDESGPLQTLDFGLSLHDFVLDWCDRLASPAAGFMLVAVVDLAAENPEAGQRYEDDILSLLGRHGGSIEKRLRSTDSRTEVHVIRFRSRAGYESFLADPDRVAYRERLGSAAPTTRVIEVNKI